MLGYLRRGIPTHLSASRRDKLIEMIRNAERTLHLIINTNPRLQENTKEQQEQPKPATKTTNPKIDTKRPYVDTKTQELVVPCYADGSYVAEYLFETRIALADLEDYEPGSAELIDFVQDCMKEDWLTKVQYGNHGKDPDIFAALKEHQSDE